MEKEKEIKSRNYCFTINNYEEADLKRFQKLAESLEKHGYICYGLEVAPSTGTKHIQGYIQLKSSQRFTYLHKYFGFKKEGKPLKFHIEIANGTHEQNKKYAQKDGVFSEFGEPVTQGARTDLAEIKRLVKENPKDANKIIDEHANNFQQVKYIQVLQPVYWKHRDPNMPPNVYWIFGATGIGKSSLVYRCFEDICSVSDGNWIGTGYTQNECLLFDDFREGSPSFEQLLKITDRYPHTLFYKGGSVPLNSPFIIFTSPWPIDHSFTFSAKIENLEQLKRRMIEINLDAVKDIPAIDLKNYKPEA